MAYTYLQPVRLSPGRRSCPLIVAELTLSMSKAKKFPPTHTHTQVHTHYRNAVTWAHAPQSALNLMRWLFIRLAFSAYSSLCHNFPAPCACRPSIERCVKGGNQPSIAGQELMCGREYEWQLCRCESAQCNFYVIVCFLASKPIFCNTLSHFFLAGGIWQNLFLSPLQLSAV